MLFFSSSYDAELNKNNDYNKRKKNEDSELVLKKETIEKLSIYFVVLVYLYLCLYLHQMIVDPMMNYLMKIVNFHDQIASID